MKTCVNENIGRLEIAMDDLGISSVEEASSTDNVLKDGEYDFTINQYGFIVKEIVEGSIFHEFHDKHGFVFLVNNGAHDLRVFMHHQKE